MQLASDVPPPRSNDACIVYSSKDYFALHCLRLGVRRLVRSTTTQERALRLFHLCHKRNRPDYTDPSRLKFQEGMECSDNLLLIASPESAASDSVADEIGLWLPKNSADDIVIVQTRGTLVWDPSTCDFDPNRSSAINSVLKGQFTRRPQVFDMTWAPTERNGCVPDGLYRALLRNITAAILGCPTTEIVVDQPPKTWHWDFMSATA